MPHKKLAYEQGVQKALQDAGLMEKEAVDYGGESWRDIDAPRRDYMHRAPREGFRKSKYVPIGMGKPVDYGEQARVSTPAARQKKRQPSAVPQSRDSISGTPWRTQQKRRAITRPMMRDYGGLIARDPSQVPGGLRASLTPNPVGTMEGFGGQDNSGAGQEITQPVLKRYNKQNASKWITRREQKSLPPEHPDAFVDWDDVSSF